MKSNKSLIYLILLIGILIISVKGVEGATSPYDNKYGNFNNMIPAGTNYPSLIYNSTSHSFIGNGLTTDYMLSNPTDLTFNIANGLTVAFSLNFASTDTINTGQYGLYYLGNQSAYITNGVIERNTSKAAYGQFMFNTRNATNDIRYPVTTAVFKNLTNQINITIVYSNINATIYVNGVYNQTVNTSINTGLSPLTINKLQIGNGNGPTINGSMYYIYFWNTSLNSSDVALINTGVIPQTNNLMGGYDFTNEGCYTPKENSTYVISSDIDMCTGNYYNISMTSKNLNIYFNCNNSIINNPATTFYRNTLYNDGFNLKNCIINNTLKDTTVSNAVLGNYRADNVLFENLLVTGFGTNLETYDITSDRTTNFTIKDSIFTNANGCGANVMQYGGEVKYINSQFNNARNISTCTNTPHGVYISYSPELNYSNINGTSFTNCSFINNTLNSGLQTNNQVANYLYSLSVINSTFIGNNLGFNFKGCQKCLLDNNYFSQHTNFALALSTTDNSTTNGIYNTSNSIIKNNVFYNNSVDVRILTSSNNSFINNTYTKDIYLTYNNNSYSSNFELRNYTFDFTMDDYVNNTFRFNMQPINVYPYGLVLKYNGKFKANINNIINTNTPNISILNQLSQSPYNDIKNTSNGVILASNVDNYSLTLSPNQQIEVGDFSTLIISLPSYPSGYNNNNNVSITVNITDNGNQYNYTTVYLYDRNVNILETRTNYSKNFIVNFNDLDNTQYYFRVLAYNNKSQVTDTGLEFFSVKAYGTANCTNNEHKLWQILPLIILAGILLYILATIEAGIFGTVGFIITLVIILNLIANLINVILTSC